MKFSRVRGTRDLLPEELAKRRRAEAVMREVFESFCYKEIQTPVFESLELITAKSGESIKQHLYHFEDKSGRNLALRPELTAPVMRVYVNELAKKPKPLKLYYFGNCFRYEEPQAGRYREFWQAGVELIGSPYPEAEAEVIALAVEVLKKLQLKNFELHTGSIGVLRSILKAGGIEEKHHASILNAIDKGDGLKTLLENIGVSEENKKILTSILELAGDKEKIMPEAVEILRGNEEALKQLKRLEEILGFLKDYGVEYKVNMGIARGLDYYTGVVFEIYANKLGAQKQICGGGTYSLAEIFGGEAVPTCGFAFGFDRVLLALEMEKKAFTEAEKQRILVVPAGENMLREAVKISEILRKNSPCEIDLMRRKLGKALSYADAEGVPFVVIVGEEELKRGCVVLRNMNTGEQKEVKIDELALAPHTPKRL